MHTFWPKTQQVLHIIGDFQARLILTLLYGVLILPVGVALRLSDDVLQTRTRKHQGSYWQSRPQINSDLQRARQQG